MEYITECTNLSLKCKHRRAEISGASKICKSAQDIRHSRSISVSVKADIWLGHECRVIRRMDMFICTPLMVTHEMVQTKLHTERGYDTLYPVECNEPAAINLRQKIQLIFYINPIT